MKHLWWSWDIRMHWAHGMSFNADSFVRNYRLAIEAARDFGVEAIIIWGFLRDMHGGLKSAHEVLDFARKNGVEIYPGIGIDDYGGVFYQGNSRYSLDVFIEAHPEAQARAADGTPRTHRWPVNDCSARKLACPGYRPLMDFYRESVRWLIREFDLAGFQIEQGDNGLCYCPVCRKKYTAGPDDNPRFKQDISSARMIPVIHDALSEKPSLDIIVETYSGLLKKQVEPNRRYLESYPREVSLSWQAYNGFMPEGERFLIDENLDIPGAKGCLAIRANSDAALGECENPEELAEAVRMARRIGLDRTYMYGEYPAAWPRTFKAYQTWSRA